MKWIKKGQKGYIIFQRKVEIAKTIMMLALSAGLYIMGIVSTGNNQNYLTLVAVLGCLPMAKFAVNSIMLIRAKGCSKILMERLNCVEDQINFWDLYYTTYKKNYQISAMTYKKGTLIGISEDPKILIVEAEEHIKESLKNCGYENVAVKLYTDADKFINRVDELKNLDAKEEKDNTLLFDNLLSISI